MTPLLVLLFGVHPMTAVGTDLLFAGGTKALGTLMHGRNRTVDWRISLWLAAGSLPATAVTLFVASRFDIQRTGASWWLGLVLAAAMMLTAASLVFRPMIIRASVRAVARDAGVTVRLTVLTGVVLGVLVSLTSVGAGAIGMMALLILYPKVSTARLIGSDIAHAVPLTFLAGVGHWVMGSVNFGLLGSLLLGSLPGVVLGSLFVVRVPDVVLRTVLAVTLVVVAFRMVV